MRSTHRNPDRIVVHPPRSRSTSSSPCDLADAIESRRNVACRSRSLCCGVRRGGLSAAGAGLPKVETEKRTCVSCNRGGRSSSRACGSAWSVWSRPPRRGPISPTGATSARGRPPTRFASISGRPRARWTFPDPAPSGSTATTDAASPSDRSSSPTARSTSPCRRPPTRSARGCAARESSPRPATRAAAPMTGRRRRGSIPRTGNAFARA